MDILKSEKEAYSDSRTGRTVWRMTADGSFNVTCYPEVESFTGDEKFVIFSSDRNGAFNIFRAEVETGELACLVSDPDCSKLGFAVHPNGREAVCMAGWKVIVVDVETGGERAVYNLNGKLPGAPKGRPPAISASGGRMLVDCDSPGGGSLIAFLSLDTGECDIIYEWPGRISHPQVCPADDGLVTFCPAPDTQDDFSLPPEKRARTRLLDVNSGKSRPFLVVPPGYRATHEYWGFSGERLYFHRKSVPGAVPSAVCSIDREGGGFTCHYESRERVLGHSAIDRRGEVIVSDVQGAVPNELFSIDTRTGRGEVLCWPDTVYGTPQRDAAHVHPSVSAGGNYVDFTSNSRGSPDLYIYPLNQ